MPARFGSVLGALLSLDDELIDLLADTHSIGLRLDFADHFGKVALIRRVDAEQRQIVKQSVNFFKLRRAVISKNAPLDARRSGFVG